MGSNTTEYPALIPSPENPTEAWSNFNNSSQCPTNNAWGWLKTMQPAYMTIICVLGIIGNAFVLCVFCLHKKRCTVAEIYLSNLAAADLVMMCLLPFWVVTIANGSNWIFGGLLCRIVNIGIILNMYCSIYFLVLVSIDRYLALVKTMSDGRMRSVFCAKMSCLGIWAFGFLMSIPTIVFRTVGDFPEYNGTFCYLDYPHGSEKKWEISNNLVLIIIGFFIPFLMISYCTYEITKALRSNIMERFSQGKTEKKATHLILAVLLVFFFCWVPFHVVTFLDILKEAGILNGCALEVGNQITTYLAYSNSCVNPILYVIVGKSFRKKAGQLFKQLFGKGDARGDSNRSKFSFTLRSSL
ncbi:UNVERIFIED_CONTAM: hypothetical protein FKN15_078221 [Acipenser sinensis]